MSGYSATDDLPPGARPPRDTGIPMGIRTGPAPATPTGYYEQLNREYLIERHCLHEARREVASWWGAERYVWREFELDPLDLVQPIQYSRLASA